MKISVQTNKNVIFFETLISFISNDKDFHPLGQKVIEEFKDIKKIKAFEVFQKNVIEKKIPSHPWQYVFLSINLNDDLTPKSLSPRDGFGPNREKLYTEDLYPIVNRINTESNFGRRYCEKILPEYEIVTQDIQKLFDKENPGDVLEEFWGKELKANLVFIPDPLRVGGGSGVSRGRDFYSITGTVKTGGEIEFKNSHMISNLLHEYSHSFFKNYVYKNEELFKKNEELCNTLSGRIKKDKEIFKSYGTSTVYFEETFIRAVQILLSRRFFEKAMNKDMESKSLELLRKRKEEGFLYIEEFYNKLEDSKDPMASYMHVLEDIMKNL
ncbi:MAG TPA: DUF4932 domain-containing protein [Candidatus Dojkabacteria bacterium]|nr:DUF4932 domain-containing protein [Candidatus Dojkabacteria bacterium]